MKKNLLLLLVLSFLLPPVFGQTSAIFQCPIEVELSNDQGEMSTGDYLRKYGTKGKTRALEHLHSVLPEFVYNQFLKAGITLLNRDTLASIKCDEYGCPNLSIKKAVDSKIADQYIRIHLKDIGMVENPNQTDLFRQQKKEVKIRCRIQIYNNNRVLIKEGEAIFQSGDPITHPGEVGVDIRNYRGDPWQQELKIYEICCKMALINALKQLK